MTYVLNTEFNYDLKNVSKNIEQRINSTDEVLKNVSEVGWANFSKSSQIEPLFLYSMCMGKIRSYAKFQVSSFNILKWQPLFVNQY